MLYTGWFRPMGIYGNYIAPSAARRFLWVIPPSPSRKMREGGGPRAFTLFEGEGVLDRRADFQIRGTYINPGALSARPVGSTWPYVITSGRIRKIEARKSTSMGLSPYPARQGQYWYLRRFRRDVFAFLGD